MSIPSIDKTESEDLNRADKAIQKSEVTFDEISAKYGYHQILEKEVTAIFDFANVARKKRVDPRDYVEIYRAEDVASRTEGLVGPVGVAERLREMERVEGIPKEQLVIKIAEEICLGKFGANPPEELADQALRTALSVQTEGITAAPLEGISKVKIKKNSDGSEFLAVYYAGPIRSAGGTAQGVSVLIADRIRKTLGLDRYKPSEEEVERMLEEVRAYDGIMHLQLPTSDDEIRHAWRNLPIMIHGDPTEKAEVSGYRNIENMETNRIRGGACLVLNDGVVGRAKKLMKRVKKLKVEEFGWLEEIAKGKFSKFKDADTPKKSEKLEGEEDDSIPHVLRKDAKPDRSFLSDALTGRPIFAEATAAGGFRLRYGHARNTGISAYGLHPATYGITDDFLVSGTHVRAERPGKGSILCPVETIKPPIVRLDNGDVIDITSHEQGKQLFPRISKILFLGDMLIGYGEFVQNNYPLVPAGYCEEWWAQEVLQTNYASHLPSADDPRFYEKVMRNPPEEHLAIEISENTGIPLHPKYTPAWKYLAPHEVQTLKIVLDTTDGDNIPAQQIKTILENALILHSYHKRSNSVKITHLESLKKQLAGEIEDEYLEYPDGLYIIEKISCIPVRDVIGTTVGARMGRPEKAKARRLSPALHGLFPVSELKQVGNDLRRAEEFGNIQIRVGNRTCPQCDQFSMYPYCQNCKVETVHMGKCVSRTCGAQNEEGPCDRCGGDVRYGVTREIDLHAYVTGARNFIDDIPLSVKMLPAIKNRNFVAEHIVKGILRARHDLHVFRDGTVRYDATDAPLTHFIPREANVTVEKLKKLGYEYDIYGEPLTHEEQVVALFPQDIIVNTTARDHFMSVSKFVDDELKYLYGMDPFYNWQSPSDSIGAIIIGIAPHTSSGVIGRVIGYNDARVCWAHPFWHSAKRRNCVRSDHEILLYNTTSGELERRSVGELVEEVRRSGIGRVVDDHGTLEFDNPYPHLKCISLDEQTGKIMLQGIDRWVRGETDRWIKVVTNSGAELVMTPDHRQLIWDGRSLTKVRAGDLKRGDALPMPSRIHLPEQENTRLNILETLSKKLPQGFDEFKGSIRLRKGGHIIRKLVESQITKGLRKNLADTMCKTGSEPFTPRWYSSLPLSHLEVLVEEGLVAWNNIPYDSQIGMARNSKLTPAYLDLDEDFFRFIGLYTAEGYIRDSKGTYQINIGNTDPVIKNEIIRLSRKICGRPYVIDDFHNVVNSNKIISYLVAYALGAGKSADTKRIPPVVFTQNRRNKLAYLSGIVDGDGSVVVQNKALQIYTANKHLAADYRLLMSTLGYQAKVATVTGQRFGKKILERYRELNAIPSSKGVLYHVITYDSGILAELSLLHGTKRENSKAILANPRNSSNTKFISDDVYLDSIKTIEILEEKAPSYCVEVGGKDHNLLFANSPVTGNCDGDEDGLILLMDGLLNFSKLYLPSSRGSQMDTPLVLVTRLNPAEVDDEAFNLDYSDGYPIEFYEKTLEGVPPGGVADLAPRIESVLNTLEQFDHIPFTHATSNISEGTFITKYKILGSMVDKLEAQLQLASITRAVDAAFVASQVIKRHFIRDLMGNLRAFASQGVYCPTCKAKYRRVPLTGKCTNKRCEKPDALRLNIYAASVSKYLGISEEIIRRYGLDEYLAERIERIRIGVEGLWPPEEEKQMSLDDFLG